MRKIRRIILHHSATESGNAEVFGTAHRKIGYAEVGYHYVICNGNGGEDGQIEIGRTTNKTGAHCRSNNQDSIGICVVGNWMTKAPTPKQYKSLLNLLATECGRYNLKPLETYSHLTKRGMVISGHRDWNSTLCPGDKFYTLLPEIRREVDRLVQKRLWRDG